LLKEANPGIEVCGINLKSFVVLKRCAPETYVECVTKFAETILDDRLRLETISRVRQFASYFIEDYK
jgi:hypothetical protein